MIQLTAVEKAAQLASIKPTALEVQERFGFPAALLAAQFALESNYGMGDELPAAMHNFFGQKAIAPDPYSTGTADVVSNEWDDAKQKMVPVTSTFYVYPDFTASALAHGLYCTGGDRSIPDSKLTTVKGGWAWQRYRTRRPTSVDPVEWANWLRSGVEDSTGKAPNPGGPAYATDPQYVTKLTAIMTQFDLLSWKPDTKPETPTAPALLKARQLSAGLVALTKTLEKYTVAKSIPVRVRSSVKALVLAAQQLDGALDEL
ncbi:MAG: glucosaminidase domain-containing protein [Candidatus Nanopelagicales bacterium]